MAKVKFLRSLAGPEIHYRKGQEADLEDAFAEALIADGRAEAVEPEKADRPKTGRKERTSKQPAAERVEKRG